MPYRVRWTTLALVMGALALATPASAASPSFSSSFEPSEPQPAWTDTAERAQGVTGPSRPGIPGNVTDTVVAMKASGENANSGEVKENLVDGSADSKWLVFERTGWVELELAEPVDDRALRAHLGQRRARPATRATGRCRAPTTARRGRRSTRRRARPSTRASRPRPTTSPTARPTSTTGSTSPATAAPTILQLAELQLSTGQENPPPAPVMRSIVGQRPARRLQRQGRRRVHRPARAPLRRAPHREEPRLLLQQGLRRRRRGHARDRAVLRHLPRLRARRPRLPEHLRGRRPGLHRRHLPERPARRRPARRRAQPARPGRLEDALHQPVEREALADRRRRRRQDGRPHPRRLRQPAAARTTSAAGSTTSISVPHGPRPRARTRRTGWSRPAARTPAAASRAATTSRPPRCRTASTSGRRSPTRPRRAGSTSTTATTTRTTCRRSRRSRPATSRARGWATGRPSRSCRPSDTGTPAARRALAFRHANEVASPHYYGVTFENGLKTEIAPTDHAALFRFTFPGDSSSLIFATSTTTRR